MVTARGTASFEVSKGFNFRSLETSWFWFFFLLIFLMEGEHIGNFSPEMHFMV